MRWQALKEMAEELHAGFVLRRLYYVIRPPPPLSPNKLFSEGGRESKIISRRN